VWRRREGVCAGCAGAEGERVRRTLVVVCESARQRARSLSHWAIGPVQARKTRQAKRREHPWAPAQQHKSAPPRTCPMADPHVDLDAVLDGEFRR